MDIKFRNWYEKFGKEAAETEDDGRIEQLLSEAVEYVEPVDGPGLESFMTDLKELTEDPNFQGTGVYITALLQKALDDGETGIHVDFDQLGENPRHMASFLKGNGAEESEIVLYGNINGSIAGVGAENLTLHIAGYTGLQGAILLGGNGNYGSQKYGVGMHAKDSRILFHGQEYNTASGFEAEKCEFFAKVEPDRTINQIHGRAGENCSFFKFDDEGQVFKYNFK